MTHTKLATSLGELTVVREDGAWRLRSRDATMDVPYDPGDANRAPAANYPGR